MLDDAYKLQLQSTVQTYVYRTLELLEKMTMMTLTNDIHKHKIEKYMLLIF